MMGTGEVVIGERSTRTSPEGCCEDIRVEAVFGLRRPMNVGRRLKQSEQLTVQFGVWQSIVGAVWIVEATGPLAAPAICDSRPGD